MLVAVLKLRSGQRKRSKEELAADVPLVGYMELVDTPERRLPRKRERSALLMPPELYAVEPLAELHRCEFGPWKRRGLILYGVEETWNRRDRIDYPQAWFVRSACQVQGPPKPPTLQEIEALLEEVMTRMLERFSSA